MSNFFDLRCPKCGDEDQIDIKASVWIRATADGTDADGSENGDHEFDNDSLAECAGCGYSGKLGTFETETA